MKGRGDYLKYMILLGGLAGCDPAEGPAEVQEPQTGATIASRVPPSEAPRQYEAAKQRLEWRKAQFRSAIQQRHPELLRVRERGGVYVWLAADHQGQLIESDVSLEPAATTLDQDFQERFPNLDVRKAAVIGSQRFDPGDIVLSAATVYYLQQKGKGHSAPRDRYFFAIPEYADSATIRRAIKEYHPRVLSAGVPSGHMVWFLSDGDGNILDTGSMPRMSTSEFRSFVQERHQGRDLFYLKSSVEVHSGLGQYIPVLWAAAT